MGSSICTNWNNRQFKGQKPSWGPKARSSLFLIIHPFVQVISFEYVIHIFNSLFVIHILNSLFAIFYFLFLICNFVGTHKAPGHLGEVQSFPFHSQRCLRWHIWVRWHPSIHSCHCVIKIFRRVLSLFTCCSPFHSLIQAVSLAEWGHRKRLKL